MSHKVTWRGTKRQDKRPGGSFSDIRESGSIEQDARILLLSLYRDDYYDRAGEERKKMECAQ